MMRCAMRMQKNQIGYGEYRFLESPASGMWGRGHFAAAGYTKFDVMIVGGAGGPSGRITAPSAGQAHTFSRIAGGGGAALRIKGLLKDLSGPLIYYAVGAPGAVGTDTAAVNTYAHGGDGGASMWDTWTAPGGKGAYSSKVVATGGFEAGVGGQGGQPAGGPAGGLGSNAGSAPGNGGLNVLSNPTFAIDAMSGGGGGYGRHLQAAATVYNATIGGKGATGTTYEATGDATSAPSGYVDGGSGGGANIGPWTAVNGALRGGDGSPDYWGSSWNTDLWVDEQPPGVPGRHRGGVFLLKVS